MAVQLSECIERMFKDYVRVAHLVDILDDALTSIDVACSEQATHEEIQTICRNAQDYQKKDDGPMNVEREERCQDCKWFLQIAGGAQIGTCHRHAPPAVTWEPEGRSRPYAEWPVVGWDDFCGFFLSAKPGSSTTDGQ